MQAGKKRDGAQKHDQSTQQLHDWLMALESLPSSRWNQKQGNDQEMDEKAGPQHEKQGYADRQDPFATRIQQ